MQEEKNMPTVDDFCKALEKSKKQKPLTRLDRVWLQVDY